MQSAERKEERTVRVKENRSSQQKSTVHSIQMLLWTLLILFQMTVVFCLEGKAEEELDPAREISIYMEEGQQPEPVWTDEAGNDYQLVSWQLISVDQPARTRLIEKTLYYNQVEGNSVIPQNLDVSVIDGQQNHNVICQIQEQLVLQEEWQDGFVFPVVFHSYGSDFYHLGDYLIKGNEDSPELAGYEALLMEQIGVSSEDYRITYIQWSGEGYLDEQGELCREAAAFGQKKVRDYQVTYAGQAEFPGQSIRQIEGRYHLVNQENETEAEQAVSETTEGTEVPVFSSPPPSSNSTLWQKVIDTLLITVGVGVVLFLGGLVILALVRLAKTLKSWYNEKN